MKGLFVSHVTAVNAAGGTGGHSLWTVLISMASSLPSVNDRDGIRAACFFLFFKTP